jgi:hypothetical protein
LSVIISIIKIIFLLGFLILIHEGGHFTVAKLCKVKVNQFAIGFGPTIWHYQGKETKYALHLIPLGGFVSMEGEEEASDKEGAFNKASIPARIAIVFAGAFVNIVFGIILYFILIAIIYKNLGTALVATGEYFGAIIESIKLIFTGGVGISDLTGPVGISSLVSQTSRNKRIYLYDFNDICITWNYQFITNTSIRWRKNSYINYRSYKKKAIERKYRSTITIIRILLINCTIYFCNI